MDQKRECWKNNSRKYISKQSFDDYEILIIDQNTNLPGIQDISEKFPKSKYFKMGKNLGPAIGRNFAVNKSNGDFLLFLDDDAYLIDEKTIEKTLNYYKKNKFGQIGLQSFENYSSKKIHISQCVIGIFFEL